MTKDEIKLLKAFLIAAEMTQVEFAREAGICERTLRTALKSGKVSQQTRDKILNAIIAESMQIKMVQGEPKKKKYVFFIIEIIAIVTAFLMLLNCIFE